MMRAPHLYRPPAREPKKRPPTARGSLRRTSPRLRPNPQSRMTFEEEENGLFQEAAPLPCLDNAMYPVLEITMAIYKWTHLCSATPEAVLKQSFMIDYLLALLENATAMDEDVNVRLSKKQGGATCLHLATITGSLKCVRILVSAGARVEGVDEKRLTPLHWAVKRGKRRCIGLHGAASVNATSLPIIRFLCKVQKCLPLRRDALGNLPIHYAALHGYSDIFAFLSPFTTPDCLGHNRKTALHFACQRGANDIVKQLLKAEADPSASSNQGYTALHHAAARGQVHTVKIIMISVPRLANIRDCFGRTARELAFHRGCLNHEIDRLLSSRDSRSASPRFTPRWKVSEGKRN
eukprot:GEMP01038201.1.p1 GENE.GEMP01038201.1~~GEMP01038201.1.p1  ORF type:complete len:350 (+),score=68.19 GEMP01038201.1:119-1168(+)